MRYSFLILLLIFIGCSKGPSDSAPDLKFESVNTEVLNINQALIFRLEFQDKEGDLEDSLFVQKILLNTKENCEKIGPVEKYPIPTFPASPNQKGILEVTYGYRVTGLIPISEPKCDENDTCFYRFVLKDKAQNKSDTVNSATIVIVK